MIRSAGFEVEVVRNRQILILHARVQVKQVVCVVPTSAGGSDSNVYPESHGSLRLKADIRNAFYTVSGLWPRTGEGLPLQWSEVPLWVKQMCVATLSLSFPKKISIYCLNPWTPVFPSNHPSLLNNAFI